MRLVEQGIRTPTVRAVHDLEHTAKAHEQLATRRGRGKILLTPGADNDADVA